MRKLILALCFFTSLSHAQLEDVNAITGDLIFLTEKFVAPAADASVYQASGGWYSNFTPKEKFEVEISLQFNLLFIPNKYKGFLVNEASFQNIRIQGSETTAETPTALGNDNVIVLEGTIDGDIFEFESLEGINQNSLEHGQIQVAVGLWKQTNLIARYTPNIQVKNTRYNSFGVGVSHHLNQWFNSLKNSNYYFGFLVTYSNYKVEDTFTETDLMLGTINTINVDGKSYGFNIVGSKSLNKFDFSASMGLATSKFNYRVGGTGNLFLSVLNSTLKDLDNSRTNFKADFNINYRIKDFSINSMITFGNFTNLNLGVNYNLN